MVRNGMVYLPLVWVCNYLAAALPTPWFELPIGVLVRVTNGAAILSDVSFCGCCQQPIRGQFPPLSAVYQHWMANGEPVNSVQPGGKERQAAGISGLSLRRADRDIGGPDAGGKRRAGALSISAARGADRVGQLGTQPGSCRAHGGADLVWAELERLPRPRGREGSRLLAAIARCAVLIVQADGLDQDGQKRLAEAGYVLWYSTHDGKAFSSGGALARVEGWTGQLYCRNSL